MLKRTIFSKILILIISVSFILGISVFLVALRELSQSLEKALIKESKLFAQSVAEDIEAGYLVYILPTQPSIETTSFKEVLFIWVVQPNGKIYFADNPEMLGKTVKDSSLGTTEIVVKNSISPETGEKIKLVVQPLEMEIGESPWSLFMGVSLESIAAARKRLFLIGFGLFGLVLILFALVSFYLAKRVTNPLKELEKGVRIIGKGNLDYRIELKTRDEIEDLGQAFNQMAGDLKKHYVALEEEKNKTLAIINNFADGLLVFDREKKLSLINPQAEVFFEVKSEKVIGQPILELTKNPGLKPLASLLEGEIRDVFRKGLKIRENLVLEMTTIPLMSGQERLGNLVILHDVTREKLIDRMKTEFVSLAAHQLRTPLSAIKWITRMVLDEELGKINKEQKEFLEDSYDSNERMIALVNNLLNVSRIEEGRYLYKLTLSNIEDIIQFVVDSNEKQIKEKKIKFEFKKPKGQLPKLMLDAEKMKTAINNILDNALRYTMPGGRVSICLKDNKKEIEVQVQDNGLGIPQTQQEKVFTKFFRGVNIMKIDTEGTGLGLYIAKNIIEAHKGKIWFESEEEKGTTFYFTIPIK